MTELIYHTAYGQALPVVGVTVYDEDVASMGRQALYAFFAHVYRAFKHPKQHKWLKLCPCVV
jgi:predicted Zn-dependent peptidase